MGKFGVRFCHLPKNKIRYTLTTQTLDAHTYMNIVLKRKQAEYVIGNVYTVQFGYKDICVFMGPLNCKIIIVQKCR